MIVPDVTMFQSGCNFSKIREIVLLKDLQADRDCNMPVDIFYRL
jgi:hypothetical protein